MKYVKRPPVTQITPAVIILDTLVMDAKPDVTQETSSVEHENISLLTVKVVKRRFANREAFS